MFSILLAATFAVAAPPAEFNQVRQMCHTSGQYESDVACKCLVGKNASAHTVGLEWMDSMGWQEGKEVEYKGSYYWFFNLVGVSEYSASQTLGTCWNTTDSVQGLPDNGQAMMEGVLVGLAKMQAPDPLFWEGNALFDGNVYIPGDVPDRLMSGMEGSSPIHGDPRGLVDVDGYNWNLQTNKLLGYQATYLEKEVFVETLGGKQLIFEGAADGEISMVEFIENGRNTDMIVATTNGNSYVVENIGVAREFVLMDETSASYFENAKENFGNKR